MTEPGSLPKEWKVVRLEEVAQPRNETVHPKQAQHLRYVGLEHIDPGDVKLKRWDIRQRSEVQNIVSILVIFFTGSYGHI